MSKNKKVKKSKKPYIKIKFDRKKNNHIIEANNVTGGELIMAYQSLGKFIESKTGLPMELTIQLTDSIRDEKKEEKTKEEKEEFKDYFAKHTKA